jgi:hypothetical protein
MDGQRQVKRPNELRFAQIRSSARTRQAWPVAQGIFRSILSRDKGVYLSAPLTSGWRARKPANALVAPAVIEANSIIARRLALRLSTSLRRSVINPGALGAVHGWQQADYLYFWGCVIKEFADSIVFAPGWSASRGCTYECYVALEAGFPCFDHRLRPLNVDTCVRMLLRSLKQQDNLGQNTTFGREVVGRIQNVAHPTENGTHRVR